jgi:4-hydroxybenzoyl-CoA thioesterase
MFLFLRPVKFADVDSARLVFFARFSDYCHEALEALFTGLPGGYPVFTRERDLGIPTVRLDAEFVSPLRYGDVARFEVEVERIGRTSVTFRHVIRRDADGALAARVRHVLVIARLSTLTPEPVPDDLRALLDRYLCTHEKR